MNDVTASISLITYKTALNKLITAIFGILNHDIATFENLGFVTLTLDKELIIRMLC